ncbi:MAG: pyruvate ferredoxin oxidoreductase [Deltaproteobacteria bacterium]|uniref:Pyruvate ferredoxin oxidoreductase n=1 Tax=Candidatus Zymogenus saltonus TaxID=2844893 RepID=A0A9D8KFN0_9DELT|nr:pyruvate ferredoxin oxidoreductase [Candidatus Zymogenus saltonus]
MTNRIGMEVSLMVSEAVKLANVDVIAAYPITPQTHIVEHLSELVADGELDAEYICVESEHSAMSACAGSSAAGARTYTATASQGLQLMSEILYAVAPMRLPVVMTVANRTVSAPLTIWNDHSDIMANRDCGWIMIFVENGQEDFDQTICAFRIAEDRRVLLPVIVNMDGFILSHVIEPFEPVDQKTVDSFLPPFDPIYTMHPDRPVTMGAFTMPEIFTETKMAHDVALRESEAVIKEVWEEWGKLTGRHYTAVEEYMTDDAATVFVTIGSFSELGMEVVDAMRQKGVKVGLVKIRLFRPFPTEDILSALTKFKNVLVIERFLALGGVCGPLAEQIKAAMYKLKDTPNIVDFVCGLSGRDVPPEEFFGMYETAINAIKDGTVKEFYLWGVRE